MESLAFAKSQKTKDEHSYLQMDANIADVWDAILLILEKTEGMTWRNS